MLEYVIVGLIVAAAAFYTVRKYMPAAWRKQLSYRVGGSDSTFGRMLNPDPGCGSGCDTCKACADPAPAPDDSKRVIRIHKPHVVPAKAGPQAEHASAGSPPSQGRR